MARARIDIVGDAFYANRSLAMTILSDDGIPDFEFPPLPDDYRSLPSESSIKRAQAVRVELVRKLSDRLDGRLAEFLEKLVERKHARRAFDPARQAFDLINVQVRDDGSFATADLLYLGVRFEIPMRFAKFDGKWLFDGKDEVLYFDRQREIQEAEQRRRSDRL